MACINDINDQTSLPKIVHVIGWHTTKEKFKPSGEQYYVIAID